MTAGLIQHAFARVDQQDRQIAGGRAGGHIAGVLLVPRGVSDDKFALLGGEIAIGHVDGDALLALGLQAIHQQRQVQFFALGAVALAVVVQRRELIFIDLAGIVQQTANQGAFTVIDAAAGQKTQQALVLLRVQISFYAAFISNLLGNGRVHGGSLEIPLTFLQLHRAGLVAVNDAPLTFAGGRYQHLFNNFG